MRPRKSPGRNKYKPKTLGESSEWQQQRLVDFEKHVPNKYKSAGVQSPIRVQLFMTPWTIACQASLSLTISQSLPESMYIALVMPSSHKSAASQHSKSLFKNPDAYENYIALIIENYQYRIWDLIKNLVNVMWPSVYLWIGYCAPTGHQQLCQTPLEVSPGTSQTALNIVLSKNTQYFTV